jgi:bifunctional DNA-binding transcriptional regulator/antitoxin component of YhaV-PrlF toxin-antitoxin module
MPSLAVFWFYQEIAHQCQFVRMSIEYLISCRTRTSNGLSREYYHVQSLLIALGNISKILWPIMKRGDKKGNELRKARGKELREALGIKHGSALESRVLRDTFEHLDERMDKWFGAADRRGFSDKNVGSMEGVIIPRAEDKLRTFIPETWTIVYCGKEFKLSPAIKAVCELYDAVQRKTCQPGKEEKLLSVEIMKDIDGGNER